MNVKAHVAMVMNLDKCIGCHTCSVTCKNTWTNRKGAEYMYWNNVETKPGVGYPRRWEDQERYKGGWVLRDGKPELRAGGRFKRLSRLFYNPDLPELDDYYEPWEYDYEELFRVEGGQRQPVALPRSQVTGERLDPAWGPNWEDDLAGGPETGGLDPNLRGLEEKVRMEFEQVFMMHLPRICEHCMHPPCVAACPSGAMYKREEDGIVLVDQNACRAWRFCVTSCPYKKVYFNWHTHKAEKCTFCFPRIGVGLSTVCAETCVGRIRYIGIVLYDADRVREVATVADERRLLQAQLSLFLDPCDPEVVRRAAQAGIPDDWIDAARRSPVYRLMVEWKVALPLHPEYRTLPMVWYVPPLSPVMGATDGRVDAEGAHVVFDAIDRMRIPIRYLANLLAAGDEDAVRAALKRLAAMRQVMRVSRFGGRVSEEVLEATGLTEEDVHEMYRLLAIAKYEDRFVIPAAHREAVGELYAEQGSCGFACMYGEYGGMPE